MAAPVVTQNAKGNILNAVSIAASGTNTQVIDATTKFELQLQVEVVFGTVAAVSGVQVDAFRRFGAGPTVDTIAATTFTIPSTATTTKDQSFALPTGNWSIKLTNTDATNAVTASITSTTLDSIT